MSNKSNETLDKKLELLYDFLKKNRKYNLELQNKYIETSLSLFTSKRDRIFSLLHHTYYSQSQPKLDDAKVFFKKVSEQMQVLDSFKVFCEFLGCYDNKKPYESLFYGLSNKNLEREKDGWGEKTGALFTKKIYNIHNSQGLEKYKFWDDAPTLSKADKLYLPVDAVIKDIFNQIDESKSLGTFAKINAYLFEPNHKWDEMDLWDDLWFWGFITQKVVKKDDDGTFDESVSKEAKLPRELGFNEGKYWCLLHTPKSQEKIEEIKNKCEEFINILKGNNA